MDLSTLVLDTNILVAAGFNPRSTSRQILDLVREGQVRMAWNEPTRREIEHVLHQIPPLHGYPLAELFRASDFVSAETHPEQFAVIPDPDDRVFAALAQVAQAVLISNDEHLLGKRSQLDLSVLTPTEYWKARQRAGME